MARIRLDAADVGDRIGRDRRAYFKAHDTETRGKVANALRHAKRCGESPVFVNAVIVALTGGKDRVLFDGLPTVSALCAQAQARRKPQQRQPVNRAIAPGR